MGFTRVKDGKKRCSSCELYLPVDNFGMTKDKHTSKRTGETTTKLYYNGKCKPCARKLTKQWVSEHKEIVFMRAWNWREKLKTIVYEHYGNKCICCGELDRLFFTIDHINNDGYKGRVRPAPGESPRRTISVQIYKHIIDSGFPDDLQLLCYNCNCGKQRNFGVCPHIEVIKPYYGSRVK